VTVVTSDDSRRASASAIKDALRQRGDAGRAGQQKRYLKSELDFLGVTVPDLRTVVKAAVRTEQDVIALADELWDDQVFEHRLAAVEVLKAKTALLTDHDLPFIERLIRQAAGWALVDPLSGDIAGRIALTHQGAWRDIDRWATDADFWIRRSALLALLPGIRSNRPDTTRFEKYAVPMLAEKEFFIRKAIGWVLRELSKHDPGYVATFTGRHLKQMSGVTFREAIRRLPEADAERLAKQR